MKRRPFLSATLRRWLLPALLLCVLIVRTAVPSGWMPVVAADGSVTLAPCTGMGAMKMASMASMAMPAPASHAHSAEMHGMADHGGKPEHRQSDQGADHPCAGAGLSVALESPIVGIGVAPASRHGDAPVGKFTVRIGHGLAAPPPPARGPPILV